MTDTAVHSDNNHTNNETITAFTTFQAARDIDDILSAFDHLLSLSSTTENEQQTTYEKIKQTLQNTHYYGPNPLLRLIDAKLETSFYHPPPSPVASMRHVVIIGAGIAGMRAAIEMRMIGMDVTVIEKRDHFSRNNALHIWPSSIEDLRSIGVKFFYPKLCVGTIAHVSIRQLQFALLKIALLVGAKFKFNTEIDSVISPAGQATQWEIMLKRLPSDCPVKAQKHEPATASIPCDCLIGADGENSRVSELLEFDRKVFQGARAIGITANFENHNTSSECKLDEFGIMSIYNQDFFARLAEKGIQLENLVYYTDETHYFVMTAKKESLLHKHVLHSDFPSNAELLSHDNVDTDKLKEYIREVADFVNVPAKCEFTKNHQGQADVGIFDFSRKLMATQPIKFIQPSEESKNKMMAMLIGDALLEPFWPLGTGANRAILSALDASWVLFEFISANKSEAEIIQIATHAYEKLQTSTPEDLKTCYKQHTIDPHSRYSIFK